MTTSQPGITIYGCEQGEATLFREVAPRFDVCPTITPEPVSERNIELAVGNACISVGHKSPIANRTLSALRDAGVTYISTRSIGYNHIDLGYAANVGISVGNVEYSPDSVADYTLMLILMALRNAKDTVNRVRAHDYRLADTRGRELRDLTVGVIGTGRIGTAVLARLAGFGCRTLAHDVRPRNAARQVSLDELLQHSDVVTLHTPLVPSTRHLLDQRRIARLRRGAVVINTGRGPLIDTAALLAALDDGHVGGAALDVVEGEEGVFYTDRRDTGIDNTPLHRLQQLPNVLISPHVAYYTDHALRDTVENSLLNCLKFASTK